MDLEAQLGALSFQFRVSKRLLSGLSLYFVCLHPAWHQLATRTPQRHSSADPWMGGREGDGDGGTQARRDGGKEGGREEDKQTSRNKQRSQGNSGESERKNEGETDRSATQIALQNTRDMLNCPAKCRSSRVMPVLPALSCPAKAPSVQSTRKQGKDRVSKLGTVVQGSGRYLPALNVQVPKKRGTLSFYINCCYGSGQVLLI